MGTGKVDDMDAAQRAARKTERLPVHDFWNEKPATKFCVGFVVFVVAEIIVYVTIHWLIPIV